MSEGKRAGRCILDSLYINTLISVWVLLDFGGLAYGVYLFRRLMDSRDRLSLGFALLRRHDRASHGIWITPR